MEYTLMFACEPVSVNHADNKEEFKSTILDMMKEKYPKDEKERAFFKRSQRVYVQLMYFCKRKCQRDIDNILKYTLDGFRKYIYADDSQIGYALSQSIIIYDNEINCIDLSEMDEQCASMLTDFLYAPESEWNSCTYFECGELTEKFYHLNLEKLWR